MSIQIPAAFARRPLLAGLAAMIAGACTPRAGAAPRRPEGSILDYLPEAEREPIRAGRSEFDCGPAIERAMAEQAIIRFPAGRYVVTTPPVFRPNVAGRFAPGVTLTGEGPGHSVFEDRTRGSALFDFDSGADRQTGFRAIMGVHLEDFTIRGSDAGARTAAIRLRGCFQSSVRRVHILGRRGDGVAIPCRLGDIDGSNMIALEEVRIEDCGGWGIDAAAVPGANEISYLSLAHLFVQNCGTAQAGGLPESGGMRWKGQMLSLDQCASAVNLNVGLFIRGEAGLGINASLDSVTFENNVGRHFLCTGVSVLIGRNLQFFSNDQYHVTTACEFDGSRDTVRGVAIDGVTVRATAANTPIVAFRFNGPHVLPRTCRVANVMWGDFDHPGQVRMIGLSG